MNEHRVIVVGGSNVDLKGRAFDRLIPGTSNPGTVQSTAGGVGRNIAENLARLELPVTLLSVVGQDIEGDFLIRETAEAGVDTGHMLRCPDAGTGMYIALLEPDGEMRLALSTMDILELLNIEYLRNKHDILKQAQYIVADANIPEPTLAYLVEFARESAIPICVEPVSVAKSKKVRGCLRGIDLITPNRDELAALTGMGMDGSSMIPAMEKLMDWGVKTVVVTLGADGLCCANAEGVFTLSSYPTQVEDVTGAGDALTAGLIYGLLQTRDMKGACSFGLAAAAVAVSSPGTVSRDMSPERVCRIIAEK